MPEVWWEETIDGIDEKVFEHFWKTELPLTLAWIFCGSFLSTLIDLCSFHGRLQAMARCWRRVVSRGGGSTKEEGAAPVYSGDLVDCSTCEWGWG